MNMRLRGVEILRPARDGEAEVGERVTVIDLTTSAVRDYRLLAADAAPDSDDEVSIGSALGSALLGRRVGDVVTTAEGDRLNRFEVVEIDG
jgi:transcription elongation GreA/GreB family factor